MNAPKPGEAWAWVGLFLSLAMNVGAAWVVFTVVSRPETPLLDPAIQSCRIVKP